MRHKHLLIGLFSLTVFLLASCSDEDGRVTYPYSKPEISGLQLSTTDKVQATDSLYFSLNIHDPQTPLSTLEVKLLSGEKVISSQTIRTKGNDAEILRKGVYIPFEANTDENKEASLVLTAINVEGSETTETFNFHIARPTIPEQIYLHYEGKTLTLNRSEEDPDLYLSELAENEEGYPTEFSGKVSTSATLSDSKLIWGASEESNSAILGTESSAGFNFDFRGWKIDKITFNVKSFQLGVVGSQTKISVKDIDLVASGGYFHAQINFTEGEEFEVTGLENLKQAYNRDFFSYNEETGKLTFLRKSGAWDIYYSPTINYIWVVRMGDTAPTCYWIVGHGFTSAPVWNEMYSTGGWDTDDISKLAYVVPIGNQKYQASMYISTDHEWSSFEFEIYSNLDSGKDKGILLKEGSISGYTTGIAVSGSNGVTSSEEFVPGYYRLTFDVSAGVGNETLFIERIGD